eukprot:SAG31_NODE_22448_length_525_cov_0.849765_1_plen_125_part_01
MLLLRARARRRLPKCHSNYSSPLASIRRAIATAPAATIKGSARSSPSSSDDLLGTVAAVADLNHLKAEGDINLSPRRARYAERNTATSAKTTALLDADASVFLHQVRGYFLVFVPTIREIRYFYR